MRVPFRPAITADDLFSGTPLLAEAGTQQDMAIEMPVASNATFIFSARRTDYDANTRPCRHLPLY